MINKKIFFIINFLFVFLFSGCSLNLEKIDSFVGEQIFEEDASSTSLEVSQDREEEKKVDFKNMTFKDLTKEHKSAIDKWLEESGYNRYGDSAGVIYSGGTPLFDEASGKTMDRFEYILKHHPDILNTIFIEL